MGGKCPPANATTTTTAPKSTELVQLDGQPASSRRKFPYGPRADDRRLACRASVPDESGEHPDLRLERVAEAGEHLAFVSRPIRARQDDEDGAEVVPAGPAESRHAQQTVAGARLRPAACRCVRPIHEHDPALDPPRAPLLRDDECLEAHAARPAH